MNIFSSLEDLRHAVQATRNKNDRISFVPTMGNLHDGHLQLIDVARQHSDAVIVSIYVNPLQFGPSEDFTSYPRTLDEDLNKISKYDIKGVFVPDDQLMYADGMSASTFIEVPEISDALEGKHRPEHFRGVATVVTKLFNMVQPDIAVFGEKDFQQLLLIRKLVKDLAMDIKILGVPTVREPDGLAMSSRNRYLTAQERKIAAKLFQVLCQMREQCLSGHVQYKELEDMGRKSLENEGFSPDYIAIRDATTLCIPQDDSADRVILAAARLGQTRLIDNIRI